MKCAQILVFIAAMFVVLAIFFVISDGRGPLQSATSFEECAEQGNLVMESYPRQCIDAAGNHFIEEITPILEEKSFSYINASVDDIVVGISPGVVIENPLVITGEARGYWFFEANFPVVLTDWDGKVIAEHYGETSGDWMTEEFVPFTAEFPFESPYTVGDPEFMKRGTVILKRANASDLLEHDGAVEVPVVFQ